MNQQQKRVVNPENMHGSWGLYSHAVVAGNFMFISGQVALDECEKVVGKDIETQTEQVMKNLQKILEAENATFDNIVKIRVNLVNLADRPGFHKIRKRYFKDNLPASTLVIVNSLIDKELLVEVEAVAYLPQAKS
ncbi:MAG TPA: RidA family protein [Candidatus Limnocylindrales bacterium]|nr:RidA family protein [Candidatus Limnocylindrales bacterium]